jgi:hypothetical protein
MDDNCVPRVKESRTEEMDFAGSIRVSLRKIVYYAGDKSRTYLHRSGIKRTWSRSSPASVKATVEGSTVNASKAGVLQRTGLTR